MRPHAPSDARLRRARAEFGVGKAGPAAAPSAVARSAFAPSAVARARVLVLGASALVSLCASCSREVEAWPDGLRRAEGYVTTRGLERADEPGEREVGEWTWWYPNGELRERGTLSRGRRVGVWTQWHPNGQIRSRGERVWDDATRGSIPDGLWTYWHANGERAARGIYSRGKREGHWDYSLEDGSLDGDRTGEYRDDERLR